MGDRQVQVRGARRIHQELAVERDRLFVLAEADAGGRVERAVLAILRLELQQLLELRARLAVLVALDQHQRIVVARGAVVGRQREHGLEQQLRIVQHVARDADLRQQAHGLDVIAMLQQIGADDVLGGRQFAVGKQARGQYDLGRQALERRHMLRGRGGVVRIARHAIQPLEHAPARGQRRIDVHAAQEGIDRPRRVPQGDVAMTALLVEAAELRVQAARGARAWRAPRECGCRWR